MTGALPRTTVAHTERRSGGEQTGWMPTQDSAPGAGGLSSWGHRDDVPGPSDRAAAAPVDPRVARTQAHVLEHARRLLVEHGPPGVNFSVLAQAARVSRQTLYRYWAGPEALVADLVLRRVIPPAEPAADLRALLSEWLQGLRVVLEDPATSVAYGMLMAAAPHDPGSAAALVQTAEGRRALLNRRLGELRQPFSPEDFARLTGPLMYAHFFGRREITAELIDDVLSDFV